MGAQRTVTFWGAYDTDKPRVRILRDGLVECGVDVREIHAPVWEGVRDKSQIRGPGAWLRIAWRLACAYPVLIVRLLRARDRGVVVVPYMGQLDVVVLWPLARMLRLVVALDVFISLYDTVVDDRKMLSPRNPLAWFAKHFECFAITRADLAFLDTAAHARRLEQLFGIAEGRLGDVLVGVEDAAFPPSTPTGDELAGKPLQVLFYGQLSPLHGVETILEAARRLRPNEIDLTIIGTGQEDAKVEAMLAANGLPHVRWLKWVPYDELREHIRRSDVALGVFGASAKAASVIPNKVFQIAAVGRHIVTRDGPAIRELFSPDAPGITLVPPGDPDALAQALHDLAGQVAELRTHTFHGDIRPRIGRRAVGEAFLDLIESLPR
jgi:glycosyltransferase involved in cell wall biosynthesis